MNILNLIKNLALAKPNQDDIEAILRTQTVEIQNVIRNNDGHALKHLLSGADYLANETTVTQY